MWAKLLPIVAIVLGLSSPAHAQNKTCPTRPSSDNTNACASTAFVQTVVGGGVGPFLPLAGGTMTGTITGADAGTWGASGIAGSSINNTPIGQSTAAAVAATTLSASSTVSGSGFSTWLTSQLTTPPPIGGTTPAAVAATTLSASSTVSGAGFTSLFASPPSLGSTTAAGVAATTLSASSTVSGTGFSTYLASPPAIGGTAAAAITGTTITATSTVNPQTTIAMGASAHLLISSTAPTISSGCGGGSPSISASNGTASFVVTIGTASGSTCVLNMPTASTGWNCFANDLTTHTAANASVAQNATGSSTTQVTLTAYSDIMGTATWVANDKIAISCFAN